VGIHENYSGLLKFNKKNENLFHLLKKNHQIVKCQILTTTLFYMKMIVLVKLLQQVVNVSTLLYYLFYK